VGCADVSSGEVGLLSLLGKDLALAGAAVSTRSDDLAMNGVKKQHLPQKLCAACGRPFAWRKKWARDWDQVRFCSDACRRGKHRA
jgi:hypothetical protein